MQISGAIGMTAGSPLSVSGFRSTPHLVGSETGTNYGAAVLNNYFGASYSGVTPPGSTGGLFIDAPLWEDCFPSGCTYQQINIATGSGATAIYKNGYNESGIVFATYHGGLGICTTVGGCSGTAANGTMANGFGWCNLGGGCPYAVPYDTAAFSGYYNLKVISVPGSAVAAATTDSQISNITLQLGMPIGSAVAGIVPCGAGGYYGPGDGRNSPAGCTGGFDLEYGEFITGNCDPNATSCFSIYSPYNAPAEFAGGLWNTPIGQGGTLEPASVSSLCVGCTNTSGTVLFIQQPISTSSGGQSYVAFGGGATLTSTSNGPSYGINGDMTFSMTGGSGTSAVGIIAGPRLTGSVKPSVGLYGLYSAPSVLSAYSGAAPNVSDVFAASPTFGTASQYAATLKLYEADVITNGNNLTSGTVLNYGGYVPSATAVPGTGTESITNVGWAIGLGSGADSNSGTSLGETGLLIQGNGCTGTQCTNFAIDSTSTAQSVFAGIVNSTAGLQINGIAAARTANVIIETSNTTYTPSTGIKDADVLGWGGGGGGGGGALCNASTACAGSAGGSGSGVVRAHFTASQLGASDSVTLGTGGTGGVAATTGATAGSSGGNGGNTTLGAIFRAGGSGGSAGGQLAIASASGNSGGYGATNGGSGSTAGGAGVLGVAGAVGTTGNNAVFPDSGSSGGGGAATGIGTFAGGVAGHGASGGGQGGGISSSNTMSAGGNGGASAPSSDPINGGSAGGAGAAGGNGISPGSSNPLDSGGTGGGGGGASATAAGNGGNGAQPGGGGGGGGDSQTGGTAGTGGNGGNGELIIIEHFHWLKPVERSPMDLIQHRPANDNRLLRRDAA
jgi:hypothetical protein